jgi:hypothetical protein
LGGTPGGLLKKLLAYTMGILPNLVQARSLISFRFSCNFVKSGFEANAMLINITDYTIGYEARLNLCCSEAIAAKKAGRSVEKYQLKKKEADLKRKVTVTEVEHDESAEDLCADDTEKEPSADAEPDKSQNKRKNVGDGEKPPHKKRKKGLKQRISRVVGCW